MQEGLEKCCEWDGSELNVDLPSFAKKTRYVKERTRWARNRVVTRSAGVLSVYFDSSGR
jgi:hypothetical protein